MRENEVDIAQLSGTGQGGRITRKDVEAYLGSGQAKEQAAEPPSPPATSEPEPAEEEGRVSKPKPAAASGSEEVELSRLRIRVAENNLKAKRTAAHVWTSVEVDFERVERVRQAHKEAFKEEEGFSLTYLPFISRATIDALKAYPVVNSAFNLEKKTATFYKKVDLGIAIDLNLDGLVVARVRDADGLRLVGIAREISSLAERARSGDLGIDDLSGSTFTITNPGPFGSFMSAPIINVPNVAILSTDTIAKRPTVVTASDGQDVIAIRHIGYLGLTWDHRAFDGSTAVLFLRRIKENIESWDWEQELA
jgi:2-oxoglutarate dehydrogenase E2 component (dihydrolipoamide succinyltransferase)